MKTMAEPAMMENPKKMDMKDMKIDRVEIRKLDDGSHVMTKHYSGKDKKGNHQFDSKETSHKNMGSVISELRNMDDSGKEPKSKYLMDKKEEVGE